MSAIELPLPVRGRYFTRGVKILAGIAGVGIAVYIYRLLFGIGAATNLNDQYPWGLWIAVDVASGVALAAGGFTTAALVEIFHKNKYHALTRPALLTAMLGYTFVVIGLLADLGRYYNVWHPMLPSMWQGNSVLFEVGICVMIYLTVLYIEFAPIAIERFKGRVNLPGKLSFLNRAAESVLSLSERTLKKTLFLFIIAGVVLSCLHQSSLGTLMVIAPTKMHPLWYTSVSPLLFLLSAIMVGFPMVIFESLLASRSFKLKPELKTLSSLARYIPVFLGIYLAAKIIDLTIRDAWLYLLEFSTHSVIYILEITLGVVVPMIMLLNDRVRRSVSGLFTAASLVVLGVVANRINVFLVAYQPLYAEKPYFPHIMEILVTLGLIAALVLVYRFIVMNFPVVSVQPNGHDRHRVRRIDIGRTSEKV
ncbi:MAG: Ni/Fe-hydrogenase cytochrome b subunit [bacterium]|jgi:Ni/Fe-hydrogenase subunit HybB-like protein